MLIFASAKSNQKQTEGCGPLDSRGTVQNSERGDYLLSRKSCGYQEFLRKFATLCNTARSILNRCEGVILLRKDL